MVIMCNKNYILATIPHNLQQAILVQSTNQHFILIKHVCVVSHNAKYIAANYIILHHQNVCLYIIQNHIHQRRSREATLIVQL